MKESTAKKQGEEAEGLSRNQEKAIVALLAHPTISEAAKACSVSESSLWRWLQEEAFQKRFREAQGKAFDGALGSLQGAMMDAVDCLKRNMNCGVPAAEVQAAKAILSLGVKARELLEVEDRLGELERKLAVRGGR